MSGDSSAEQESSLQALVAAVSGVLYEAEAGERGRWLFVSHRIEELLGYSPEEWLADPNLWFESVHDDDRDAVSEEEHEALRGMDVAILATEYRMTRRDGEVIWVRDDAKLDPGADPPIWRGALSDITASRRARQLLTNAVERSQNLMVATTCHYRASTNPDTAWLAVSPQIDSLLGYSVDAWLGEPDLWRKCLHPLDRERALTERDHFRSELVEGARSVFRYRMVDSNGEGVAVEDHVVVARGRGGELVYDGYLTPLGASNGVLPQGGVDVFRLECAECDAVWAASQVESCPSCSADSVQAVSVNALQAELTAVRTRADDLLRGVEDHLSQLEASKGEQGAV